MYSTVTGSSTVSLWLWHSTRALFITMRASAVKPVKYSKRRRRYTLHDTIDCLNEVQKTDWLSVWNKTRASLSHSSVCCFEVPANAIQTCSSRAHILRTVLSSCNFATDFFSTPRTTMSLPLIPTCKGKQNKLSVFCSVASHDLPFSASETVTVVLRHEEALISSLKF